ncbi:iron uptake porin [Synechococcus elongatus]|uniref:Iron uptake porin n=2 Tax=Synechococcus elongatus TaxID=32046 RepID=A0AAQ3RBA6_SYNEL
MKNLFKVMLAGPLAAGVAFAGAAQATDLSRETINQVNAIANEELPAAQVTSITQLSDVKPTDWAYQALQSLVERYGCIVGYPDRTYRGSRALTRYEFAAGLNACLDKVIEFAASKEDLDTLKKLMEEFQAELATLRGRVDALEARVTELEATQFSTTTKLQGEVILSLDRAFGPSGLDTGTSFSQRVSLNLNTSFTGKDLLKTRLRSNSITSPGLRDFNGGVPGSGIISPAAALDYDNATNAPNANFFLDTLLYTFPVGDLKFTVGTSNLQVEDILSTTGSFYAPYISYFFSNPIPGIYGDADTTNSAGAGFNWQLSKNFNFGLAYINQNGPTTGGNLESDPTSGVFGADSQTTAQLAFKNDSGTFIGALAYAYRKGPDLATDLSFLPSQFGGVNFGTPRALAGLGVGNSGTDLVSTNNIGLSLGWAVSDGFTISGSYGISFGNGFNASNTVQSWTVGFTFPNLFADGNEFGFAVGQAPYVISDSRGAAFQDSGNFAFEIYYKLQVTDNISITPALYAITNAGGGLEFPDTANGDFWVPVIKTVFTF